uniref:Uncharacterized protein n=1 Tax=Oryza sativa subsp. japonica TaxID=39947 RepID=Q2QTC5_ORYSJ|nr:hypothetical protein LOC_Os12g20120 [Oryza sativa Japonica Group]
MAEWLIQQSFLNELTPLSWDHLDAAARGTFFSSTVRCQPIEKMLSNMGWSEERLQTRQCGMYTIKWMEMLAAQLDLLMNRVDNNEKESKQGTVNALGSHTTSEVYGNAGHSGTDGPKTRKDVMLMNNSNGNRPQGDQGWSIAPWGRSRTDRSTRRSK